MKGPRYNFFRLHLDHHSLPVYNREPWKRSLTLAGRREDLASGASLRRDSQLRIVSFGCLNLSIHRRFEQHHYLHHRRAVEPTDWDTNSPVQGKQASLNGWLARAGHTIGTLPSARLLACLLARWYSNYLCLCVLLACLLACLLLLSLALL